MLNAVFDRCSTLDVGRDLRRCHRHLWLASQSELPWQQRRVADRLPRSRRSQLAHTIIEKNLLSNVKSRSNCISVVNVVVVSSYTTTDRNISETQQYFFVATAIAEHSPLPSLHQIVAHRNHAFYKSSSSHASLRATGIGLQRHTPGR